MTTQIVHNAISSVDRSTLSRRKKERIETTNEISKRSTAEESETHTHTADEMWSNDRKKEKRKITRVARVLLAISVRFCRWLCAPETWMAFCERMWVCVCAGFCVWLSINCSPMWWSILYESVATMHSMGANIHRAHAYTQLICFSFLFRSIRFFFVLFSFYFAFHRVVSLFCSSASSSIYIFYIFFPCLIRFWFVCLPIFIDSKTRRHKLRARATSFHKMINF